ncbi:hypothetical protein [Clostridium sp.]|uniref:hypothetical protein n=1 Tax=Clostridium sp. TaxID=1506 RepID=UPI0026271B7C|nr:hypothetical protein [Clostridium sp.]
MLTSEEIKQLNEKELLEKLYGKELNTKNNILEYIEIVKILKQEGVPKELIENTYELINSSINEMKSKVKPNTIMFLQNKLKDQFRKVIIIKHEVKVDNNFIKFFKRAYPEGKRNRNFTYVLIDNSKISSEQIWTTLTFINRGCIKQQLFITLDEKIDIIEMIEKLVAKKDIKYINQLKSMDKLLRILNIKISEDKNGFKVVNL